MNIVKTNNIIALTNAIEVPDEESKRLSIIALSLVISLYVIKSFGMAKDSVITADIKLKVYDIVNNVNEIVIIDKNLVTDYVFKFISFFTKSIDLDFVRSNILSTVNIYELFGFNILSVSDIELLNRRYSDFKLLIPIIISGISDMRL